MLELLVLIVQRFLLDRFLQLVEETLGIDRFLEKIEGAGLHCLNRSWNVALACDDDYLGFRIELFELPDELDAVDIWQHHVGHDRVGPPTLEQLFAARPYKCRLDFIPRVLEEDFQPLGHRRFVIDGQDALLSFRRAHSSSVWFHRPQ